ncbi:APC family permease [Nocardioides sp. W3-2-3]|nr:APC family permease [Nocardioides convexus]
MAYAPDEVFIMLAIAGASQYVWSWKIAIAVALVMAAVIASYRQTVHAYPSGGGDYEVATVNLGRTAGMTVASALLVDYVLTVAVSISSGANYASSAIPAFQDHEALVAVVLVLVLMAINLRGIRESGSFFAVPTYLFMFAILGMCAYGFFEMALGDLPLAESASLDIIPKEGWEDPLTTFGLIVLLARAFSSGCAALTGVEAISNGVPAFKRPKSKNAATTLLLLGLIAISMMLSVIVLAKQMGLKYVDPHELDRLTLDGAPLPDGYDQHAVIAQIAQAVFHDFSPGFYFVVTVTGVILVLAANTAFNGFPVLGSILAKDGLAPRALGARGDRLAYSNGIVFLALMAIVLIIAFDAETTKPDPDSTSSASSSPSTSARLGMIRHWTRHLATERDPGERRRMVRSRTINAVGLSFTAVVLVVVLLTKFLAGAWITILAMCFFFAVMKGIKKHYDNVERETRRRRDRQGAADPGARDRAGLQSLHKPTLRALAFAKATRPNSLEGVYVSVDEKDTARLLAEWDERNTGVPLKVLHSPYREVVRPIIEYATAIRGANPRAVVAVYIPEYVVGRWWEQTAPQPDRAAAQGPAAVHPGRDGHLRALPACAPPASPWSARSARSTGCGPVTCAVAGWTTSTRPGRSHGEPSVRTTAPRPQGTRRGGDRPAVRGRGRARRARRSLRGPRGGPGRLRAPRAARGAGGRRGHRGDRG